MSYSAIIQKDSPAIVYSLDDSSVSNNAAIAPDRFLYKNGATNALFYGGIYNEVSKISFPIVFGGKQSIRINNNGSLKIPSLDKMSLNDVGNQSSIEFWIKINTSSSSEQVIMSKKDSGSTNTPAYETRIYVKNDYITFRLGTSDRYYEASVNFDSVNKPLHIVASYSPSEISLTVNGVRSTTEITYPELLFPVYDSNDEFFYFEKPSGISNLQIDCIAIYSYVLSREKLVRHFVYGCGYNPPAQFINSNGGVLYNFSMDGQSTIKKYDFSPSNPWSLSEINNVYVKNGTLSLRNVQEPTIIQKGSLNDKDVENLFTSTGFDFTANSYLEIKNADSIVQHNQGGWVFKFNGSGVTLTTTKQTLFNIESNGSQDAIECYLIKDGDTNKIVFDVNNELSTSNAPDINGDFYVGYFSYQDLQYLIYGESTSTSTILYSTDKIGELTFDKQSIRIGSDNTWKSDNTDPEIQFEFTGKLKEVRSLSFSDVSTSLAGTAVASLTNRYTLSPNQYQKRFIIASSGTATIDIPQQALCPILTNKTGANRIDIGHPLGSTSLALTISNIPYSNGSAGTPKLSATAYTDRSIVSGDWLNGYTVQEESLTTNPVDIISFKITLSTEDLVRKPATLNFLRLFSYELQTDDSGSTSYILCDASPGGNKAKIYLTGDSKIVNIPDILETPILYNGFYSGLSLKNNYTTINHDRSSLEGNGIKSISFMLYFDSGQSSGTYKILDTDVQNNVFSVGSTGTITKGLNTSVYINGSSTQASSILLDQWQQVTIIYTDSILSPLITLGNSGTAQATSARIDQLILFSSPYVSNSYLDFVKNLYDLTVGVPSYSKEATTTLSLSDSSTKYLGKVYLSDFDAEEVTHIITDTTNKMLPYIDGSSTVTVPVEGKQDYNLGADSFPAVATATYSAVSTIQVAGNSNRFVANQTKFIKKRTSGGVETTFNVLVTNAVYNNNSTTTLTLASAISALPTDLLFFTNYYKTFNEGEKQKAIVNSTKLSIGDTLLINTSSKKYKYTVSTLYNVETAVENFPGYITLVKESLVSGKTYIGNLATAINKYKYNGTAFEDITSVSNLFRLKIRSKNAPNQNNTFTTEE